jgi:hypothetical protein
VGQRPYKPDTNNMRAIVRMATFVPPERYTDLRQTRRILISAQERRAPTPEFHYSKRLSRFSPEARDAEKNFKIMGQRSMIDEGGVSVETTVYLGFAVQSGTAVGEHGDGYRRLSYANSMENIQEAIEAMRGLLETMQA